MPAVKNRGLACAGVNFEPGPVSQHRHIRVHANLHFLGVPCHILQFAGFNLVEVPISGVLVTSWCYQLKVNGVKLPSQIHIALNQGAKPQAFQFSKRIGVGDSY